MLNFLFTIFDIPLIFVLMILIFSSLIFVRNIYNVFLSLFSSILLMVFIASAIISQQVFLGEFLIISIFFLFSIIFFVFNLKNDYDDENILSENNINFKMISSLVGFFLLFVVMSVNFYKINSQKENYIKENQLFVQKDYENRDIIILSADEEDYNYKENISILNQNHIFQKLTQIIMFYVCIIITLYFFNKEEEENER